MIEECERPGWVAQCPNCKHKFSATLLKSWGGTWIVFYSSDGNYIYLDDYNGHDKNILSYVGNDIFDEIIGYDINISLNEFNINNKPKCPECSEHIDYSENIAPESILWIDGQIVIDGKIKKASRVSVIVSE